MKTPVEPAIIVKDVHKEFILPQSKNSTFKQTVVNIVKKNNKVTQKVLDGVDFQVNKGDFFGVVGRNGSGKSTLLKILAGVYTPTSGEVEIRGGLTPFIELGVGFNPELSGRDNVYLNGALLGFTRKQMDVMYDDIVAFAELEPFMEQKLKNYSSGMQVRLAFSIAIKAENDILIFDEVLAVGDSNFQEKCIRQFKKFKREGRTVVLVTHSMETVEQFCNKAILISEGKIELQGDPGDIVDRYNELNMTSHPVASNEKNEKTKEHPVKVESIKIINDDGVEDKTLDPKSKFSIDITLDSNQEVKNAFMAVRICESQNQFIVAGFDSDAEKVKVNIKKGKNRIMITVDESPFVSGKYYILLALFESAKREVTYARYSGVQHDDLFMVKGAPNKYGLINIPHHWDTSN